MFVASSIIRKTRREKCGRELFLPPPVRLLRSLFKSKPSLLQDFHFIATHDTVNCVELQLTMINLLRRSLAGSSFHATTTTRATTLSRNLVQCARRRPLVVVVARARVVSQPLLSSLFSSRSSTFHPTAATGQDE